MHCRNSYRKKFLFAFVFMIFLYGIMVALFMKHKINFFYVDIRDNKRILIKVNMYRIRLC